MAVTHEDFVSSSSAEPHKARTQRILDAHPNIRALIGTNPATFLWTAGIVALQLLAAWLVAAQPWWVVVVAAYTLGAAANHALFVLIHECAHRLVFKRKVPNYLTALLANVPQFFPGAIAFVRYHLKHHVFQGVYELDADLPSRWEADLVGHSAIGKALWLLLYPVFQVTRPYRIKEVPLWDRWTVANVLTQAAVDVGVWLALGPRALVYFALSLFFSVGLHPLGARWIQRHYLTGGEGTAEQETFSYYGPLNRIAFNVGYHNEHHDFPSVPWNRLPRVAALAPEAYESLSAHRSWTRLLFQFLFDKRISLFSRMVRTERNQRLLNDPVRPDIESIEAAGKPR